MYSKEFQEIIIKRRSNRKFDPMVNVPNEIIQRSLERSILSPNSSNMQLWEFYWIQSEEERQKFIPFCLNQSAAKTAKQLVVFVARKDLWKKRAAWNLNNIQEGINGEPTKAQKMGLNYYGKLMPLFYRNDFLGVLTCIRKTVCFFSGLRKPFMRVGGVADQRVTVNKSCALAAQTFMLSIAAEGFDSCPMEGFDQKRVKKELNLPRSAEITMIIAVGKGSELGVWGERKRVPFEEVVFVR